MVEVKTATKPKLADCVVYKNKKYDLNRLMRQSGPILEINVGQLHAESNSLVEGTREVLQADYSLPLVNKFEGFYVVLLGRKAFDEAIISKQPVKCRLISNPALKNAVVF